MDKWRDEAERIVYPEKGKAYIMDSDKFLFNLVQTIAEALSRAYQEGEKSKHHPCCNFPNREIGTCNCIVVMKGDYSREGFRKGVEKCLDELELYNGVAIVDEIAEKIKELLK